jgi:PTS system glucitol/sorbitol-specific IIA component
MIKYQAQVTYIGPMVSEFIDNNILVLFGNEAPEELREFAVIHDGTELVAFIEPGDSINITGKLYKILAVGEVSNTNLANLGHLVLKFNGETIPEMPGDICLENEKLPEIQIGSQLIIEGKN